MLKQNLIRKNLFLCKRCMAIRIYEDSLFKRTEQVVSLSDKRAGESAPKSRILEEKSTNQKSHVYGENNRDKDG